MCFYTVNIFLFFSWRPMNINEYFLFELIGLRLESKYSVFNKIYQWINVFISISSIRFNPRNPGLVLVYENSSSVLIAKFNFMISILKLEIFGPRIRRSILAPKVFFEISTLTVRGRPRQKWPKTLISIISYHAFNKWNTKSRILWCFFISCKSHPD